MFLRSAAFALAMLVAPGFASAQALDGYLKKIKDTKTISIAYRSDALPFSFVGDAKEPTGYSIDLCRRVVSSIEQQIGVQGVQIKWVPVTLQTRLDAVAQGQADMECGSTTVTLARMKQVSFSTFTFVDGTGLLIKAGSQARSLSDLSDKKIGVIAGTTNEKALNEALKRKAVNAKVVTVKSREEGLSMVESGQLDAFASDKTLLMGLSVKAKDPKALALLVEDLSFEPYAIALPRNDDNFRLAVNTGLAQLYRSEAIVDIYKRWFGALGKPGLVLEANYLLGGIPD